MSCCSSCYQKTFHECLVRAAGISDAVKLGSSKLPPIDPFHEIDPMLGDESESSNRHLLALCDVTAKEFELLIGKKLGPENDDAVTDDETDSRNGRKWSCKTSCLACTFFSICKLLLDQKRKKKKKKIVAIRESFFPSQKLLFAKVFVKNFAIF